jgi:N6-L-threonylcarbamoyladenine synthase
MTNFAILSQMKILGIESSCDETAAAVVEDGRTVLSNVIASQIDLHAVFGGVVPEIAARSHIEAIVPVIEESLEKANIDWSEIDGIAVTAGPGLLGSLLVGTLTSRSLALTKNKPLYAVNHVVAHTFANFLIEPQPTFPMLALSVSGGHSHLLIFNSPLEYRLIGQTIDDAAGEAFDKVGRVLGLPFPGGPAIGKIAPSGDEYAFSFPKARLGKDNYNFSFSGLKTAVLREAQKLAGGDYTMPSMDIAARLSAKQVADIAASFQRTVVETLTDQLVQANEEFQPKSVVIAGGVAANSRLREEVSRRIPLEMHYAPMVYCTDNAAMIASLGYYMALAGQTTDPVDLVTDPSLAF